MRTKEIHMNIRFQLLLCTLLSVVTFNVHAAKKVTGNELNSLLSGKTLVGHNHVKDFGVKEFYSEDGRLVRIKNDGLILTGKWWLNKKQNKVCIQFVEYKPNKKFCHSVTRDKNNEVIKLKGNGNIHTKYDQIIDGNVTTYSFSERQLNKNEMVELFSGKTAYEDVLSRGEKSVTYYNPDGNLHCIVDGKTEYHGSWSIESGEFCVEFGESKRCRLVVENNGVFKKYKLTDSGAKKHVVTFEDFRDGNAVEKMD
jgi:hypothetical protein